jgi:hypothetical protein
MPRNDPEEKKPDQDGAEGRAIGKYSDGITGGEDEELGTGKLKQWVVTLSRSFLGKKDLPPQIAEAWTMGRSLWDLPLLQQAASLKIVALHRAAHLQ